MRKFYFLIKFGVIFLILLSISGIVAFSLTYQHYAKDLPKLDSLRDYNPKLVTEVFADDGTKIGEFWQERRLVLQPHEIPTLFKQAIISSEDKSFMQHSGIDYIGIIRAMIENIKAGRRSQGASTITQQVVKTFILSPERTYERKIKEAILAKRLEDTFGKEEILYLYLNQIYFGNKSYGIEAAAQNYFRKNSKNLNVAEAAMIAGLVKAPGDFSPLNNYKRAKERQEYVIKRMFEENYITAQQREEAVKFPLKIYQAPTDKEFYSRYAPWIVEKIRQDLIQKYGRDRVYKLGLKIHTTVDLKAQKAADKAVWRGLTEIHKRHGYNGPLKKLLPQEFETVFKQVSDQIYKEQFEEDLLIPPNQNLDPTQFKLNPDKIYQAVVTEVTPQKALVQVGFIKGEIISKDYGWARPRNNNSHGYNNTIYVSDATKIFKVGDLIEVKIIPDQQDAKNKKLYQPGTTYFSLEETPKIEGALFSYDPFTGFVKAVVGGKDFSKNEFNRATQALRQTGSIFKPFLYAASLDKGYTEDTKVEDLPIKYEYAPGKFWSPQNYGGGHSGEMLFRSALITSRNLVSVRLLMDIGLDFMVAYVRKLGITSPLAKVYPMSLGANEMKLEQVSHAFGVFPTGGILAKLIYVKKVTDRFDRVLEINEPQKIKSFQDQIKDGEHIAQVSVENMLLDKEANLHADLWLNAQEWIKKDKLNLTPYEEIILYGKYIPKDYTISPKSAYTMVKIMRDVVRSGTGYEANKMKYPAAGKTGTTNDLTDCWFVGFTPNLVAGVWTGHDQNKNKVGGGETGGKAAAPIFRYYMESYLAGTEVVDFKIPEEINTTEIKSPVTILPSSENTTTPTEEIENGNAPEFLMNDF